MQFNVIYGIPAAFLIFAHIVRNEQDTAERRFSYFLLAPLYCCMRVRGPNCFHEEWAIFSWVARF